ncbi:hypothetical protein [Deinococcus sp. Marseille-Q6407]|uniref:hypothetical protein n=1 Tax=Deinococcus sp. Marseille-Q6407 TaxID=2969223 RepID=UPI0021C0DDB5|nr:hypothetical protein [Deinococcus sp. Marseille-Q6407]
MGAVSLAALATVGLVAYLAVNSVGTVAFWNSPLLTLIPLVGLMALAVASATVMSVWAVAMFMAPAQYRAQRLVETQVWLALTLLTVMTQFAWANMVVGLTCTG